MVISFEKGNRITAFSIAVLILGAFFSVLLYSPLFGLAFALGVLVFAVSLFNKEKVIFAFAFLYPLLPKGLAVDIGASLPLITASRILILYVVVFELVFNRTYFGNIRERVKGNRFNVIILLYLIVGIINFFAYPNGESFKILFSIIIEYFFVAIFIYLRLGNEKELEKFIDCVLAASLLIGVSGIIEFFWNKSVFSYLNIVDTERLLMTGNDAVRLGVRRVEGPFGHPLAYCNYLIMIIPFALYKFLQFKEKRLRARNLIILLVLLVNFVLTLSRGPMLAFAAGIAAFFLFSSKKEKKYISVFMFFTLQAMAVGAIIGIMPSFIKDFFISVLDAVLMRNSVSNFGGNRYAHLYRLYLFELGAKLVFGHNVILGRGMGFFRLNQVYDYVPFISANNQILIRSIDNHYILRFIETGMSGLLTTIMLAAVPIINCIKKILNSRSRYFYLCTLFSFTTYFVNLFTVDEISTLRFCWVILGLLSSKLYMDENCEKDET